MRDFSSTPAPADDRTTWDGVSAKVATDYVLLTQWKQLRALVVAISAVVPTLASEVGAAASTISARTVTTAPTLTATDEYVRVNSASALNCTVPTNASVSGRAAWTVVQVRQVGAGQVTLVAAGGVTISGLLKTAAQNTSVTLIKTGTDTWDAEGGVA